MPGWRWTAGPPARSEGGDERWLITYSDMITLLLVLFIILYSMANTDLEKFQALAESLKEGFGASAGATEGEGAGGSTGGDPVFEGGGPSPIEMFPENQTPISIFQFAEMLEGIAEGEARLSLGGPDTAAGDQGDRGLGDEGDAGAGDAGDRANLGDQGDQGIGDTGERNLGDQPAGDEGRGDEGDRNLGDQGDEGLGDEGRQGLGGEDERGIGDAGDRANLGDQGDQGIGDTGERNLGDQPEGDMGRGDEGDRNLGDQGDEGSGDEGDRNLGDQGDEGLGDEGRQGIGDEGTAGGEDTAGSLRYKLRGLVDRATEAAGEAGLDVENVPIGIQIDYDERGIRITAVPSELWFESGSARLKPHGREFLELLAPFMIRLPNRIEIQGHTDSVPINTMLYPSNWELSAGRSGSVIRYLMKLGVPAERLQAAGYADTMPKDTNATKAGRASNRRVEILILRDEQETWSEWLER